MDTVREIATALGESEPKALKRIAQILEFLGTERTQALVAQAMKTHAGEGMWYKWSGKSRRRTLGGCFFRISKDSLTPEQRAAAFHSVENQEPLPTRPLKWEDRVALLKRATADNKNVGKAITVKIVIVGRPSQVFEQPEAAAVLALLEQASVPPLPKGLPTPQKPTRYAVYISGKQWRKVVDKLKDPSDALVVEGFAVYDDAFAGITVMATSTSTKKLKAEQTAKLQEEGTSGAASV